MLKLAKAGNAKETDSALGADARTRSFSIISGYAIVSATGDLSSQTLTVEMSPTGPDGTFVTYTAKDATGTAAAVTIADDESVLIVGPGQTFRVHCGNGGTPDVDIFVAGDGVILN